MKKFMKIGIPALLILLLSGCGEEMSITPEKTTASASAEEPAAEDSFPETEETRREEDVTFQGRILEGDEKALYERLREKADGEILLFDCADYDGDGSAEAFAFSGKEENGVLSGSSWFVSPDGEQRLKDGAEEYIQNKSEVMDTPEEEKFWYTESDGGSATMSFLWGVQNGKPVESLLSGKGMNLEKQPDGGFILYQSSFDAAADGTGHTYKPCYFFYQDHAFREYGAQVLTREELFSLEGAREPVSSYEKDGGWITSVYLRGNGLVQVNLSDRNGNKNLTLEQKNGRLVTAFENDGAAGLLIGGIEDGGWHGPDGALQTLWEEKKQEDLGVLWTLRPDENIFYDLDGDGALESVEYHVEEDEEYGAATISLTVGGEQMYGKDTESSVGYRVHVADVDRADKSLELIVEHLAENDIFVAIKLLRLENGRLTELGDLHEVPVLNGTGSLNRLGMPEGERQFTIPGDGTLTVWGDTPVYTQGLGCYYVRISFSAGAEGIVEIPREEYEMKVLYAMADQYPYIAAVAIPLYESPAAHPEGNPVFIADPGEVLFSQALFPCTPEAVYAKLKTADGAKEGWTLFGDVSVFTETPAWG